MSRNLFFVMIKPDGVRRGLVGKILSRFERRGFELKRLKMVVPDRDIIERHYEEHSGKIFFDGLVEFTISGPVIAMIWQGDIQVAGTIVGDTLPWKAEKGTIRGDYASSMPENLLHCSDSLESAKREIGLWFRTEG